ncbi:MAG: acetyl-CoA decarbonylase/synthase complex subunit gamma [Thermodesulfobacteriota bacterium]|jgi:acetyl-CoA decarbonylase/synthase complex subunit gamma|nr:MAG: acetyl-CoA decarbonylase/synthase complex subunit gamma [Thermodesulfobacteriota bacterium]
MGLTGIQIFKLLPKTNCAECGVPTCLAFAMKLAAGQAELESCPYVSDEAKAQLAEASAPPIRPVVIGSDDVFKCGGETVQFRHEKTFVNPAGIAVLIADDMNDDDVEGRLKRFQELKYERVGLILKPDLVALQNTSGNKDKFLSLIKKVMDAGIKKIILMSDKAENLQAASEIAAPIRPLLYAATKENVDALGKLAKEKNLPLAVKGKDIDEVMELTTKLTEMGLKDLVIDSGSRALNKVFTDQVSIRRAALVGGVRALGFPTIAFPCEMSKDLLEESLIASTMVSKYAGIMVLSDLQGESLFPLLVQRMNIYTDPQRPMATSQGIYEINLPTENSPVLITSNFSLTYFIVSGEVENSRVPSWLLVLDTEGLSVLTSWAAGKFSADRIALFLKKSGILDKVKHRKLVIPGYAASISGELEEELPDWEIQIGPREGAHIPAYLKTWH